MFAKRRKAPRALRRTTTAADDNDGDDGDAARGRAPGSAPQPPPPAGPAAPALPRHTVARAEDAARIEVFEFEDDPAPDSGPAAELPSYAEIRAAKERRLRRRNEEEADYVPISQGSALVREDPMDDEPDPDGAYEGPRIPFGKVAQPAVIDMDQGDADADADDADLDDEDAWQQEQIRRGAGVHLAARAAAPLPSAATPTVGNPRELLASALHTARTQHDAHAAELADLEDRLRRGKGSLDELSEQDARATAQFLFYKEMQRFVRALVGCLDDKVAMIDELDRRAHALRLKHGQERTEERAELWRAEAADHTDAGQTPAQVDEFGRDLSYYRQASRRQREARRREKAAKKTSHDPWSDSDDDSAEHDEYRRMAVDAASVFADADDAFADLSKITQRFVEWHRLYPRAFADAFVSLSMQSIALPFARLDMVTWDPLLTNPSLQVRPWYRAAHDYDTATAATGGESDPFLVPFLVEAVAVNPTVELVSEGAWDATSLSDNRALLTIIADLALHVAPHSEGMTDLMAAVQSRLGEAVAALALLPCDEHQDPDAFPRRVWGRRQKMSHILTLWAPHIAAPELQALHDELRLQPPAETW